MALCVSIGALLLVATISPARGYIYYPKFNLLDESSSEGMESGITMSEGPMFASQKGPFGGGDSLIGVKWALEFGGTHRSGSTDSVNVHVAFLDSASRSAVGLDTIGTDDQLMRDYCCTQALSQDCGAGVIVGGLIQHPGPSGKRAVVHSWTGMPTQRGTGASGDAPWTQQGNVTYLVQNEGPQWMLTVVCDAHGTFPLPDGTMSLEALFKNPQGYLPGSFYGFLPWSGTLFVAYALFAAVYSILFCMRRKHLIGLQWLILGVVYMGALEMAVSFGVFDQKNKTGVPTPCNVCPVTSDYLAMVILAVFKRAVSRVLLLAVAKGYGVVHANLPWRTWVAIISLGFFYLLFGSLNEVERETSFGLEPSGYELLVLVMDLLSLIYIYGGFNDMRRALTDTRQLNKRIMYDRLWAVIVSQVAVYIVVAGIIVAVRMQAIPFPWKSLFFLVHFWDLLYLIVLFAIAYLWRPGPDTAQYAYYAQPASSADEADADDTVPGGVSQDTPEGAEAVAYPDSIGLELGPLPNRAGSSTISSTALVRKPAKTAAHDGIPPDDAFVIEAHDEDDGDLSRGTGSGASVSSSAHAGPSTTAANGTGKQKSDRERDTVRLAGVGQTVDDRPLDLTRGESL